MAKALQAPIVTISGIPVLGAGTARWRLAKGVNPVIELFDIATDNVERLIARRKIDGITLVMEGGGERLVFKKLTIVGFFPGENEFITKVALADRRWTWPYKHVLKRFNIHRNAAFKRRKRWDEELENVAANVAFREIVYAVWSVKKDKIPFKPLEIIRRVLTDEDAIALPANDVVFEKKLEAPLKKLNTDNVEIDDSGESAVGIALGLMPQVDTFVAADGKVIVFSTVDGGEVEILDLGGPEIVRGGHVDLVTNEETRPKEVHVLFTIEAEVRFDHVETDQQKRGRTSGKSKREEDLEKREIDNVIPLPDFFLDIKGKREYQSTWVDMRDYFKAIAKESQGLLSNMSLDRFDQIIRQAFLPELDLWAALGLAGNSFAGEEDTNWATRLGAIQGHYRQTYRINRRWVDRVLSFQPYLIGTIDSTSGQRAPAVAYSDYAIRNTLKALIRAARRTGASASKLPYATNYYGFTKDLGKTETRIVDGRTVTVKARPSPAIVTVEDSDQGILRVNFVMDEFYNTDIVFPSTLNQDSVPDMNIVEGRKKGVPITFDSVFPKGKKAGLSDDHRVAIIVTAVPAAPNSDKQLYRIIVKPDDVKDRLPKAMQAGLKKTLAPIKEVRIGAGLATARIRWKDEKKDDIEAIFGLGPKADVGPDFNDLVINDTPEGVVSVGPGSAALSSIRELALAVAAQIYAKEHDRHLGSRTVHANAKLRPAGNLADIAFEMGTDGVFTANFSLPDSIPDLDIQAFLDESTRRILFRQVQPRR